GGGGVLKSGTLVAGGSIDLSAGFDGGGPSGGATGTENVFLNGPLTAAEAINVRAAGTIVHGNGSAADFNAPTVTLEAVGTIGDTVHGSLVLSTPQNLTVVSDGGADVHLVTRFSGNVQVLDLGQGFDL